MKRKLELKDIAGYLPYRLHCINCDDIIEIIEFDNVGNLMRGIDLQDEAEDDEWVASQQYKSILRPLSDLYRTITHDGKEIVPIVDLAKISFPNCEWEKDKNIDSAKSKNGIFFYDCYKGFYYRYKCGISDVYNQYQLFDYLHELKIDYRGLIDAGLAVSVYDLEDNPYK